VNINHSSKKQLSSRFGCFHDYASSSSSCFCHRNWNN